MMNNDTTPSTAGANNPFPVYGANKIKLQMKSLISILNHNYDLELLGNVF
jgi:hypothetical protein